MSGQPRGFDAVMVIPTEPAGRVAPALIVEVGDSITLKTYLHCDQSMDLIYLNYVMDHLVQENPNDLQHGEVEYHLQNLETGAMVPRIHGAIPALLPAGDVLIAFGAVGVPVTAGVVRGDLQNSGLPTGGTYFISAPTDPITTGLAGSGADLRVQPAPDTSGTWRILVHAHGHTHSLLSAFNDECIIVVEH